MSNYDENYIRRTYGVPATIGVSVIADGAPGVITGFDNAHVLVNHDGWIKPYHPTWRMIYLVNAVNPQSKTATNVVAKDRYGDIGWWSTDNGFVIVGTDDDMFATQILDQIEHEIIGDILEPDEAVHCGNPVSVFVAPTWRDGELNDETTDLFHDPATGLAYTADNGIPAFIFDS